MYALQSHPETTGVARVTISDAQEWEKSAENTSHNIIMYYGKDFESDALHSFKGLACRYGWKVFVSFWLLLEVNYYRRIIFTIRLFFFPCSIIEIAFIPPRTLISHQSERNKRYFYSILTIMKTVVVGSLITILCLNSCLYRKFVLILQHNSTIVGIY